MYTHTHRVLQTDLAKLGHFQPFRAALVRTGGKLWIVSCDFQSSWVRMRTHLGTLWLFVFQNYVMTSTERVIDAINIYKSEWYTVYYICCIWFIDCDHVILHVTLRYIYIYRHIYTYIFPSVHNFCLLGKFCLLWLTGDFTRPQATLVISSN